MHSTEELIDYIYAKQREIKLLSEKNLVNIKKPRIQFSEIRQHADKFCESKNGYYTRFIMIPGIRGVGKTTMLYQLYAYLTKEKGISEANVFYLDVEDLKSAYDIGIKEVFDVYLENVHETIPAGLDEKVFLLVDEAQLDNNWANTENLYLIKHSMSS